MTSGIIVAHADTGSYSTSTYKVSNRDDWNTWGTYVTYYTSVSVYSGRANPAKVCFPYFGTCATTDTGTRTNSVSTMKPTDVQYLSHTHSPSWRN